ncbi:C4-type zinc ribbon domain-containing protein [candidate division KSB1 bacterium]|nr:C4-type zinc ribbon domain-containing protein [candidate division KSB1 bacterium]
MLEDLKTLVDLQNVDSQLFALERAKGDLPHRVMELKSQLDQLAKLHRQKAEALQAAQSGRRTAEGALQMAKERKKKYDNQLYSVKNNKEYDAVTAEIEAAAAEIDETETRILEAIEQEETLQKELAEQEQRLKAVQSEYEEQKAILAAREAETRSMTEVLQSQRNSLVVKLRKPLLGAYKRILNGKDGLAVVEVIRGSCGGCLTRIPPQRVLEIREMSQIHYCESCGRILVWNNADEETANKIDNTTVAVA